MRSRFFSGARAVLFSCTALLLPAAALSIAVSIAMSAVASAADTTAEPDTSPIAIPPLSGPVIDQAKLLSPSELASISAQLQSYLPTAQIQVWILNSTNGEPIETLSLRAVDAWKLGTEKGDNGMLLTIAVRDRKMRIEVGQGLEGSVPDVLAGRIVRQILRPAFQQGAFAQGISAALVQMHKLATGDTTTAPAIENDNSLAKKAKGLVFLPFILLFLLFAFLRMIGGGGSRRGFGRSGWGSSGPFIGGGWGSGGSSGSSWSGGGGGFSGGGSSGDW